MKSEDINNIIREYDNKYDNDLYNSCIGDKVIPYIGWFWRTVNFDADHCWLGILPEFGDEFEHNDKEAVGFMEKNKWGYNEFEVKGEDWVELRQLIETAVTTSEYDDFKAVDDKMQSLLKEYRH